MAKAQARDHPPRATGHNKTSEARAPNRRDKHGRPSKGDAAKLILSPRPDWHAAEIPPIPAASTAKPIPLQLLERIHAHADSLLKSEASNYATSHLQTSSSYKFMSTIMNSGTWSDKVSALTLVVQESPLHTLKPFENLIALAGKRSRTQALMALEALKDMLSQGNVLPGERKLRMFTKQPALISALQDVKSNWTPDDPLPSPITPAHLALWAYEDRLKAKYFDILKILESWCNDEVEYTRLRAVTFIWELLKEKPEQEENLLRLLVNKLGDTSKKVASRASHLLLQLQTTHPPMKPIIISAIESDILLRPNQNLHAKYYAVITLNQTVLQTSTPEVASKLLDVYFSLFVTILNRSKKAEVESNSKEAEVNGTAKKRRRNPASQAQDADRPDQEMEEKIVAQVLTGINRAFPFSKKDSGAFEKHLDTMFKITHSSNFNTSIQALMLIQQISATHNISTDHFLRTLYESLLDPRLLRSSKHTMYLNLLYRSLKSDVSVRRVKAFVKRLLQIMELHEPPFVCALLYLIIELQNLFPGVKAMLEQPEAHDEDEEVFVDVPDDADAAEIDKTKAASHETQQSVTKQRSYDGRKRDPEHSNAENTCLWELSPWTLHYHPSVTLFASHLAAPKPKHPRDARAQPQPTKPDPNAHSLIHFLDRFAYRKPRTKPDSTLRGSSLMQPALASSGTTDTLIAPSMGAGAQPLNSENFWARRVEDVAPDEVFFHRYFAEVGPRRKAAMGKKAAVEDGDGGGGEFGVEDEEEIWKVLAGSGGAGADDGDVDGDGEEEDDDVAMFDYDDDDEDDEDGAEEIAPDGEDGADLDGDLGGLDLEDEEGGDDEVELNLEDDDSSAMFSSEEEGWESPKTPVPSLQLQDDDGKSSKRKRRKLKDLPTFASAEDYAELIAGGDDDADEGD